MILTEDEAKTKLCCGPKGCGVTPMPVKDDNGYYERPQRLCIASGCMAWKWAIDESAPNPPTKVPTMLGSVSLPGAPNFKTSTTHGYCGLAE